MRVIGTSGHIDHGKSTLVAALTGTHPDRLKEEQLREMTIELGFGWMTLPNGEELGIVDVPGHRDFIENMLSGIGGIDAAMLVIAADEGVMPQTREHLAILDILEIPAGLIVLTKTDLASDITPTGSSAWLDLVESDIRLAVAGTVLQDAPILRVSAKNKTGIELLISVLQSVLEQKPARADLKRPRLPVDRVFTMSGFGTVVTGTLSDGYLSVGDEVEILPAGLKGRIRGLQTHKKKEETAVPGSRTAVNISGITLEEVRRGDVISHPDQYQPTRRLDARFRLLKESSSSIKHGDQVKFFVSASETIAILRLLGTEELSPGEEAWIQLELREPVVTVRGDRYILRRPSPGETLGGGMIVDHHPRGRHRRFDEEILNSLDSLAHGTSADVLLAAAMALNIAPINEIVTRSRLEPAKAAAALTELLGNNSLIALEEGTPSITSELMVIAASHWKASRDKILGVVETYHKTYPLRRGILREELKSRLKFSARLFNAIVHKLITDGSLKDHSAFVAQAQHEITFNSREQVKVDELMRRFEQNPFSPPGVKELRQGEVGEEILNALLEMNELKMVSPDVIFRKGDYDFMVSQIRARLLENGRITLAEVRDLFNTSRKYAQALMEHLDANGITMREGDFRKLSK